MLDLEGADGIEVTVDIELDASLKPLVTQARAARQRLDATQRVAQESLRVAAIELHDRGISMRDIGSALNLSFQRVHQILDASRRAAP